MAIQKICHNFEISETLAGMTLLAFANGAPDLITSFSAVNDNVMGINLIIGAIFGACAFVSNIVLGKVILTQKDIIVNRVIYRDIFFYLGSIGILCFFGIIGEINIFSGISLFCFYILYVFVVIKNESSIKNELLDSPSSIQIDCSVSTKEIIAEMIIMSQELQYNDSKIKENEKSLQKIQLNSTSLSDIETSSQQSCKNDDFHRQKRPMILKNKLKFFHYLKKPFFKLKLSLQQKFFGKIDDFLWIFEFPFNLARNLTIPMTDQQRVYRIFQPTFIVCFVIGHKMNLHNLDWQFVYISGICFFMLLLLGLYIYFRDLNFRNLFPFVALITSTMWILLSAELLLDFLDFIAFKTRFNIAFLGVSLLAWGNSIGDFFSNSAMARIGLGQMAISAIFAGQLFNFLIGFGISLLKIYIKFGTTDFQIFQLDSKRNIMLMTVLVGNAALLIFIIVFSIWNDRRFNKTLAKLLFFNYTVFLLMIIVINFFFN